MNAIAIVELLAQQATTQAAAAPPPPDWMKTLMSPFTLVLLLMLVFYMFMSKSKRTDEKSRKEMLNQMKRGDRIQTIGGVLGKIVDVEDSKVLVKVDESSNTKIWFSRSAIHRVDKDEKETVKT